MGDSPSIDDGALRARKHALRGHMRDVRDAAAPEDTRRAAGEAARHLIALPELQGAATVAVYAVRGSELDPAPAAALLRARGVALAFPRVIAGRSRLAFHLAAPEDLVPGVFGLSEPAPDAPVVPLERIDAFVVPGLAFDPAGHRLGWGRGYFDSTLAAAPRAVRIGYAYARQVVAEVPSGPRDVPVDIVVSETGAARTGTRQGTGRR